MGSKDPIYLVYIISFVDLFAIGLTFPLLSTHLRNLGASHTFIGFLGSLYSGLQVFSGPIIGGWTDVTNRQFVLKKILLLCAICYGLLGVTNSFVVIVILRIILGFVKHIQSICKAVITDILPHQKHSEGFGRSAAISSFGFILGPFFGGLISELPNGFTYVCLLTMGLFLFNMILASYMDIPDKKYNKVPTDIQNNVNQSIFKQMNMELAQTISDLKRVNWHKHWESFSLRFLFGLAMSTYFSNQSLILTEKYQLSQKHSGYIISYFSIIGTTSAFFIDKIRSFYKTNDYATRLLSFFMIMAFSVIAIFISPNVYIFLLVLIPFSVACTALRIVSMELIIQETKGEHRGSLSGASNSVMSVSRFIAPLITGVLGDKFGEEYVILVAVIPAMIGVVLCFYLRVSQIDKNK